MAYSYTTYTGDGSTTDYAVVFPYLDTDHVNLTVDGVSVSFSWVNSGTVRAAVAPANATVVRVSRSTSRDARIDRALTGGGAGGLAKFGGRSAGHAVERPQGQCHLLGCGGGIGDCRATL